MRLVVFLAFAFYAVSSFAFDSFTAESEKVTNKIKCPNPKITAGSGSWGALYGCIGGQAETVKFFINEDPDNGQVKSVKFLWNDWARDGGHGKHADKSLAKAWASVLGTLYAPRRVDQVLSTFFGTSDTTIESESYLLKYTYNSGPGIDERMFVVIEK